MKRITKALALVLLAGTFTAATHAATLSLEPGSSVVTPGSVFSIDLVVSGLGDAIAPSVGDFDIDIGFDPLALGLAGFGLGPGLGEIGLGEAIDVSFGEFLAGLVNVAEVSFLTDGELNAGQPDSFVLATLDFMVLGLAAGDSTFIDIVTVISLGDATGSPIAVDGVSGALVTAVPLPAALLLFAGALAALTRVARKN